jgi:hypothetical protein
MICTPHQIFGPSDPRGWERKGMWHIWGTLEMHTGFWWGNLEETDHVAKLGIDVRRILKWILEKQDGRA